MSVQANSSAKTINSAIITVAFLKQHHACKEGIDFFQRNFQESLFPNGLDLSKIKVIEDYNYYFLWINDLLKCKFEYDSNENMIKKIHHSGIIEKYNQYGDIIKKIYSNGYIEEWQYEYDYNGNMIKKIPPFENICKYEYDYNGNKIKEIYSNKIIIEYNQYGDIIKEVYPNGNTFEYKYEYDSNGNKIKKIFPDGYIKKYIFKYDSIGRLVQVENCYIEYLE